ncbi:MAG: EthD family reductase [Paracoccus sp. (in: a-proteobacteria)]
MSVAIQIMYPAGDGNRFDEDYFHNSHMKLVARVWGSYIQSSSLLRGIGGGAPGTPPAWAMVVTLTVADMATLQAMMAAGAEVMADVPNYSNVTPQVLIGEVIG